jgi:hypothetical protein
VEAYRRRRREGQSNERRRRQELGSVDLNQRGDNNIQKYTDRENATKGSARK